MNIDVFDLIELDADSQREIDGGLPGTGCPACDGPQIPGWPPPTYPTWPPLISDY